MAAQLQLSSMDALEWTKYREGLQGADLTFSMEGDTLTWAGVMKEGTLVVKHVYFNITLFHNLNHMSMGFEGFWKRNFPTKVLLFRWLVWREKILTWDNLTRRGYHSPSRCIFCREAEESINHIFFTCPWTVHLWSLFNKPLLESNLSPTNFMDATTHWDMLKGQFQSLPFFFIWEIWLGRNRYVFDNVPIDHLCIHGAIMAWKRGRMPHTPSIQDASKRTRPHPISLLAIFFDGACQGGIMGCGAWLKLSEDERIEIC